jgi:hypothetical protein
LPEPIVNDLLLFDKTPESIMSLNFYLKNYLRTIAFQIMSIDVDDRRAAMTTLSVCTIPVLRNKQQAVDLFK